jgi:hypothetical protein
MIAVCDIDGTFADHSHRIHLIEGEKRKDQKNWDAFYDDDLMIKDAPIPLGIAGVTRLWNAPNIRLVLLTGRPEKTRAVTRTWLKIHFGSAFEAPIYMRKKGDLRKATEYKREQISGLSLAYERRAMLFIDDDERNFEMYQGFGVVLKAPECWGSIR